MKDSIDLFLTSISQKGYSEQTVRAYANDLRSLATFAGSADLIDAAEQWITATRDDAAPKTTLRRVSAVRAFGRWAGVGLLVGYRVPRPARPVPHPIPEGMVGVRAMLSAATEPRHAALIALCGLCGLRVSEARSVKRGDVSDQAGTVTVRGKGDRERIVPLSTAARAALAPALAKLSHPSDTVVPMSDRGARAYITRLGQQVLGHDVASHDLRATVATAAAHGNDIRVVQELLGHADLATTQVYTDVTQDEIREALEGI